MRSTATRYTALPAVFSLYELIRTTQLAAAREGRRMGEKVSYSMHHTSQFLHAYWSHEKIELLTFSSIYEINQYKKVHVWGKEDNWSLCSSANKAGATKSIKWTNVYFKTNTPLWEGLGSYQVSGFRLRWQFTWYLYMYSESQLCWQGETRMQVKEFFFLTLYKVKNLPHQKSNHTTPKYMY